MWWLDLGFNYTSYYAQLNTYFVNLGNPSAHVPGWIAPNQGRATEAIFAWGVAYASWFMVVPILIGTVEQFPIYQSLTVGLLWAGFVAAVVPPLRPRKHRDRTRGAQADDQGQAGGAQEQEAAVVLRTRRFRQHGHDRVHRDPGERDTAARRPDTGRHAALPPRQPVRSGYGDRMPSGRPAHRHEVGPTNRTISPAELDKFTAPVPRPRTISPHSLAATVNSSTRLARPCTAQVSAQ
jgi:hypothetical protein